MKEILKEIIVGNQNAMPAEVRIRSWEIPVGTDKIITIPGVRRSGKSSHFFIAQNKLLESGVQKEKILFLSLDDERLDFSGNNIGLILDAYMELYPKIPAKEIYFFLDEIQIAAGWEKFVRRIYDTASKNIYLTGSNSKMLSSEIATALRGRTLQFEIFPLSFSEFCDFKNIEKDIYAASKRAVLINAFNEYLFKGGFPEIALGKEVFHEPILQEYYYVMIFKDLVERYKVKNVNVLRYLVKRLLANLTKPTSANKIFNEIKSAGIAISKNTVYELLGQLENIYMFLSLPKFNASSIKEFSGTPKYYVIDNGFNYALQSVVSENRGSFLENLVYLHLRRKHPFGKGLFYFKEKYECDFMCLEKQSVSELIQACWSLESPETRKREINGLLEAAKATGCKNLKIITNDFEGYIKEEGLEISVLPAWKFFLL
ncbi:MAG: ATP-binding protein [Fibromonadales bacterium]|nr:ATP-binding protein [Fibromonadales bacterium]